MSQRTPAVIRALVQCLIGNRRGLDLLDRVLADLDPTLCVLVPPPPANDTLADNAARPIVARGQYDRPFLPRRG
jgi:hypothetical protein